MTKKKNAHVFQTVYIAYGSNLDLWQMEHRCPTAVPLGTGVIKDYRIMFKGSLTGSYATIEKAKGYEVPVLLWALTAEDEASLDRYEGYPSFYYKRDLPIADFKLLDSIDCDINISSGMAYIMHEYRKFGIPSEHYYNVLYEGYKTFGFDTMLLAEGLNFTRSQITQNVENEYYIL